MQKCRTIELSDYRAVGLSIRTPCFAYSLNMQSSKRHKEKLKLKSAVNIFFLFLEEIYDIAVIYIDINKHIILNATC